MTLDFIPGAKVSSSGLDAQRERMEVIANNLANVNSTRGDNGGVYQRRVAIFSAQFNDAISLNRESDRFDGVKLTEIKKEDSPPLEVHMPWHPDADPKTGMVKMPNVSPIHEMLDLITATRAYEANLAVMRQSREMAEKTVDSARSR